MIDEGEIVAVSRFFLIMVICETVQRIFEWAKHSHFSEETLFLWRNHGRKTIE